MNFTPYDILNQSQANKEPFKALDIYNELKKDFEDNKYQVPNILLNEYAMLVSRWLQAEDALNKYGLLIKGSNDKLKPSPYVSLSQMYFKQANECYSKIENIINKNCNVKSIY